MRLFIDTNIILEFIDHRNEWGEEIDRLFGSQY